MPSFISCGLAVIDVSIGASAMHREYCAERMEAYRRPDCRVPALLDTGADATIVDLEILENLCLSSHDSRKVEAFNGTFAAYPVYVVSMKVHTKSGEVIFENSDFEVVGVPLKSDNYSVVLGMDILDAFTLKFHRKTGFVELAPTATE